jgi:phosphopantothenoylcysteine decarboxylase/phosphopantothenate--cysteine ligase
MARRILLIVAGGIAAYKSVELIRRVRDRGLAVRTVLTEAGAQFVTPLSLATLSGDHVYSDLFSLTDEHEVGHIRLSRAAELVVVAPATANLMAKLAGGIADDLASTVLLATDKPVLMPPSAPLRGSRPMACASSARRPAISPAARLAPAGWPNRPLSWPGSTRC